MARPAPADDGSPGRLIATMVGIVGILLLGSLAWSAVGALFSAVGDAAHALSSGAPVPKLGMAGTGTPTAVGVVRPPTPTDPRLTFTAELTPPAATPADLRGTDASPTPGPNALVSTPTSTRAAEARTPVTPGPDSMPTPPASGRAPWVLLPGPAPGAHVPSGPQVIEARGRGDSAIRAIRLELDGAALEVSLEQRSESVWRGSSSTQVAPGQHAVRATVVDDQGRSGSFGWTFEAGT